MPRVIAVQEEQLKMLKEKYKSAAPQVSVPQNNADILSGALGMDMTTPVVAQPTIDMESQVVNLNLSQPSVIQPDITNQIFGSTPSVQPTPSIPEPNLFSPSNDIPSIENPVNSASIDVPYQEPVMNGSVPVNEVSDEENLKHINSIRNKLTTFYNDMNLEIDKLQEKVIKTSGVNLVESSKVSDSVEKTENSGTPSSINDFSVESRGGNIFDVQPQQPNYDETMVIPRDVMDNAIAEVQNSVSKAA